MANWLHCNKCFQQLQKSQNEKFFFTNCGHVVCEKCSQQIKVSKTCVVCAQATAFMQLSKEMDPSILCFFSPPDVQIKKCAQISEFQNYQKDSLIANLQNKYASAKEQCMKQLFNNNKLIQEVKMLRERLRKYNGPISSTPAGANSTSSFQNMTAGSISSPKPKTAFKFGGASKSDGPLFNPLFAVPGVARRMATSKCNNSRQSISSQHPSPIQVVPSTRNRDAGFVPIHRSSLDTTSPMNRLHPKIFPIRRFNP